MAEIEAFNSETMPKKLGKYQILKVLGRGSMGVVYKARDPEIDRLVAIKTLQSLGEQAGKGKRLQERLLAEARSLGKLRHSNIITIFDAHFSSGTPYLVMDFVSGESLDLLLKRVGHLTPAKAVFYLDQIASAIDYAHKQGVVHRDLKPANCMLEVNDRLYVLDFGIAKIQSHFAGAVSIEETIVGTPAYMAPEQIRNERALPATDLFSFAVLAFQLVTGKRPFDGNSYTETMGNILSNEPASLTAYTDLPLALDAVFAQALAKEPFRRFPNARKFVEAFAAACNIKNIAHPNETSRDKERQRIAVWDASQRSNSSRTLYHGNLAAPVVQPSHTLGPGAIFSHHNDPVKESIRFGTKWPFVRVGIGIFAVLALLSGATLLSIGLDSSTENSAVVDEIVREYPKDESERLRVVVGESMDVPEGKMVSAMTDAELSAALVSDKISTATRLEALKEVESRNLPTLKAALPYLLEHDSYVVRSESLNALNRLRDSSTVQFIIPVLGDLDPTVRKSAAEALASIGSRKAVGALKKQYGVEADQVVRRSLKKSIEKITGIPYNP